MALIKSITVKLVTPAMIGGAEAGQLDQSHVLRPPEIRGMLRFWSRALGGPALESDLWGSISRGQGVSVLAPPCLTPCQNRIALFPHKSDPNLAKARDKQTFTLMYQPGDDRLGLRFRLPDAGMLPKLGAVAWTWLHLGAIGRRSRRGYGSLLWVPTTDDLLVTGGFKEWEEDDLSNPRSLAEYLRSGLGQVRATLGAPDARGTRVDNPWFRLSCLDQVFVGKHLMNGTVPARYGGPCAPGFSHSGGMEWQVHGFNENSRSSDPTEKRQMGKALGGRQSSPMLWRLFPVRGKIDDGYIPVMTWSPLGNPWHSGTCQISKLSGMYGYLNGTLGFHEPLKGPAGLPLGV